MCFGGCRMVGTRAYGDAYTTFANNDPAVVATCRTAAQAGCGIQPPHCPCAVLETDTWTCCPPPCVAGKRLPPIRRVAQRDTRMIMNPDGATCVRAVCSQWLR
jgi:hypothetical protein